MAQTVDDLTIQFEEDGVVTCKELGKKALSKGAWSTVMFKYQDWDGRKQQYTPPKYRIVRYQKRDGVFKARSKFNISSDAQAEQIITTLKDWMG